MPKNHDLYNKIMANKIIEEVYGRQGNHPSAETMTVRKRVVGAVSAMNGNIDGAKANLDLSNPSHKVNELKKSTIKCYWDEFQSLSENEKKDLMLAQALS